MAETSILNATKNELMKYAISSSIIQTISIKHERLKALFEHNPSGAIEFLIINGAVTGFDVIHEFNLPYDGSGITARAWKNNGEEIKGYLFELCQKLKTMDGVSLTFAFKKAAEDLAIYIHQQYVERLPAWPKIFSKQTGRLALDKTDWYVQENHDIIAWSCIGAVTATDETTLFNHKATFTGSPVIRAVKIDGRRVKELEILAKEESLEYTKEFIDSKQRDRILSKGRFRDLK